MQHNQNQNHGQAMHDLVAELFPIHRSLTGEGVRQTLEILKGHLPDLKIHEVPTGTQCFDWTIPREWRINEAYIIDPDGNRICDIADNNLHLVSYSTPINQTMTLEELDTHLHSLPEQPDAIPYVTSYYKDYWGFCLSDSQRQQLQPGQYQVVIDSELFEGSLTYGELKIPVRLLKKFWCRLISAIHQWRTINYRARWYRHSLPNGSLRQTVDSAIGSCSLQRPLERLHF